MANLKVLILTNHLELSKAIERYVRYVCNAETYYGIYKNNTIYDFKEIYNEISIFIIECYRYYENGGLRNEGIKVSKELVKGGKRIILFSVLPSKDKINYDFYWDIIKEKLSEKVKKVLESPPPATKDLEELEKLFPDYSTVSSHHHSQK